MNHQTSHTGSFSGSSRGMLGSAIGKSAELCKAVPAGPDTVAGYLEAIKDLLFHCNAMAEAIDARIDPLSDCCGSEGNPEPQDPDLTYRCRQIYGSAQRLQGILMRARQSIG